MVALSLLLVSLLAQSPEPVPAEHQVKARPLLGPTVGAYGLVGVNVSAATGQAGAKVGFGVKGGVRWFAFESMSLAGVIGYELSFALPGGQSHVVTPEVRAELLTLEGGWFETMPTFALSLHFAVPVSIDPDGQPGWGAGVRGGIGLAFLAGSVPMFLELGAERFWLASGVFGGPRFVLGFGF